MTSHERQFVYEITALAVDGFLRRNFDISDDEVKFYQDRTTDFLKDRILFWLELKVSAFLSFLNDIEREIRKGSFSSPSPKGTMLEAMLRTVRRLNAEMDALSRHELVGRANLKSLPTLPDCFQSFLKIPC